MGLNPKGVVTYAWRKLVQPPNMPRSILYSPLSLVPCTRVIVDPFRVGVVRQETSSSPAAAPIYQIRAALLVPHYVPRHAEARAVMMFTLSDVFLAMFVMVFVNVERSK